MYSLTLEAAISVKRLDYAAMPNKSQNSVPWNHKGLLLPYITCLLSNTSEIQNDTIAFILNFLVAMQKRIIFMGDFTLVNECFDLEVTHITLAYRNFYRTSNL